MNKVNRFKESHTALSRRNFLQTFGAVVAAASAFPVTALAATTTTPPNPQVPLKLGIRAATMRMVGDLNVIKTAAGMPGIRGVELQVAAGDRNLTDLNVVRQYKRESDRWDMRIPSIAGIWEKGVNISSPKAGESLLRAIRAAEILGSRVVLVAFFGDNAPDMNRDQSFAPIVETLKRAGVSAADAGVVLGLETSLSPADNVKLVDLVAQPAVRIYYDLFNMSTYGHTTEAVPGVKLFGRERICAVHVKNGNKLIEEPGPIDWPAAFAAFNEIVYDGWFTYETAHQNLASCIADTAKNNTFLSKHLRRSASL